MQATGMTQMNTRMEASLKEAGDRVLAVLGYSPSQAVRALWSYLCAHRDDPASIRQLLDAPAVDASVDSEVRRKLDALAAGRQLCARLGPLSAEVASMSSKDLLAEMYAERYDEGR